MDEQYWIKKWQEDKDFVIENDRLKKRVYLYTPFPKTNLYGFQNGDIRGLIACDILARYQRMRNRNVLFPTGCHSLCRTSFVENKKYSNLLNDDLSDMYNAQTLRLGIGLNEGKHIDMRHSEYLANLQQAFIDLYDRGYIEYKEYKVFHDKKNNKIYDTLTPHKNLPTMLYKCFVLNISSLLPELLTAISALDCDMLLKNKLVSALAPKKILHISFGVSNGAVLNLQLEEPQYMGGISFLFLNPEYIDITDYVDINEYGSVFSYLEGRNPDSMFAFSGLYARNPLTGKEIPIFISTLYPQAVYSGIPGIDEEDRLLAEEEGLEILEILAEGRLVHSDFLDDMLVEEARKRIFEVFCDAELAQTEMVYGTTEFLLSSLDNFGPLFPFLEDKDTGEIFSLSGHLPYAFSSKLRPVLPDNVDILGTTMNGTINNLFTEGMCPILAMLYDNIGSVISVFSEEAIKEFEKWRSVEFALIKENELYSSVFFPLIFYTIIQKETGVSLPPLIHKFVIYDKTVDISFKDIQRANNNLIDLDALINQYSADAVRFFSCSQEFSEPFVFNVYQLEDIAVQIKRLSACFKKFTEENAKVDYALFNLIKDTTEAMDRHNVTGYIQAVASFIKTYVFEYGISQKQGFILLRLLFPVFPFLTEDVYKNQYNGKYSLINEDWPN